MIRTSIKQSQEPEPGLDDENRHLIVAICHQWNPTRSPAPRGPHGDGRAATWEVPPASSRNLKPPAQEQPTPPMPHKERIMRPWIRNTTAQMGRCDLHNSHSAGKEALGSRLGAQRMARLRSKASCRSPRLFYLSSFVCRTKERNQNPDAADHSGIAIRPRMGSLRAS